MKKNHAVSLIAGALHFVTRRAPRSSLCAQSCVPRTVCTACGAQGLCAQPWCPACGVHYMLYLIKELRVEKIPL